MKKLFPYSMLACIFLAFFVGCKNEENSGHVVGKWTWVRSTGGFAGHTVTPASEGYKKQIVISDTEYAEYRGDSLLFKIPYELQAKTDSTFNVDKMLVMNTGVAFGYQFKKDTLELIELCFDCYRHYYIKD